MSAGRKRAFGLAFGAGVLACAGPTFEVADLPDAPIALVYRTVQESERVIEDAEQRSKQPAVQSGSAKLDIEMERILQSAGLRSQDDVLRDQFGHVSFYIAPEKRLEGVDFAARGSWPLEWSADHARLLFAATSRERYQLFEWIAASGEVRQLTSGARHHQDGCYGPGGAFAYVEAVTGPGRASSSRIWIQRPGEPARPVTSGPADAQPSWSPDGMRLVYAASDPGAGSVLRWVDPASGEGGTLARGRTPVFTRDGQWIVFSARTTRGWKLWRMRPDGSAKRSFGKSAFQEEDPSVSPDGRFVVFAAKKQETSPTSRLFVRPLDGSADRHLELSGSGLLPVW